MKLTLTRSEMLARRRLAGGFEPLRTDCTVGETAGTDIDALLSQQIRSRYLELLDTADPALLAPEDVAADTALTPFGPDGVLLSLPSVCRRVLSVRLAGWSGIAPVLPESALTRVRAMLLNPFTAPGACTPVAVALSGGRVAAWPGGSAALEVIAVCDHGPDIYKIDERALWLLCESQFNPPL